jgi:WD40 repeat protein
MKNLNYEISKDQMVCIWNSLSFEQTMEFYCPNSIPIFCKFSHVQEILAIGYQNGILRIFHLETMNMIFESQEHTEQISNIYFSPDGNTLYTW